MNFYVFEYLIYALLKNSIFFEVIVKILYNFLENFTKKYEVET
jgi:hypothetical protein